MLIAAIVFVCLLWLVCLVPVAIAGGLFIKQGNRNMNLFDELAVSGESPRFSPAVREARGTPRWKLGVVGIIQFFVGIALCGGVALKLFILCRDVADILHRHSL